MQVRPCNFLWLLLSSAALGVAAVCAAQSAAQRRAELLATAQGQARDPAPFVAALEDPSMPVRRLAVRCLTALGAQARPGLVTALDNSDTVVRRAAILALFAQDEQGAVPQLQKALADEDEVVRMTAVDLLATVQPQTEAVAEALRNAANDPSMRVRDAASRALWPFHRDAVLLKNRPDWDHEIEVLQAIELPLAGWRLQNDDLHEGHTKGWYEAEFDDSAWESIEIGRFWDEQTGKHDGIAWYRGRFDMPPKMDCNAVEIQFQAVDEVAWVWLNGEYVGQHDIGPNGWDIPFRLSITDAVRWGETNQITVRVHNSAAAGGIWKPVTVEVLK